jgi:DNA polymerase-1
MTVLLREDILACSGYPVAIDTETTGLRWYSDGLIGIGIHCPQAGVSGYAHICNYRTINWGKPKHKREWNGAMDYSKSKRGKRVLEEKIFYSTATQAIPEPIKIEHFRSAVHEIAADPKTTLIGHNLKFDAHFLGLRLWELPCKILDTAILTHLVDCRLRKSLAAAENHFLGTDSKRSHVSEADKRFNKSPWMWGEKVLEDYCTNDCVVTYQLAETLMPKIRDMDLAKFLTMQLKYLRLLQKTEWRGFLVKEKFCYDAIAEFDRNIVGLERDLFDSVGFEFDYRSSNQMSDAIYDRIGIERPENPFIDEWGNKKKTPAAKIYTKTSTGTPLLVKHDHPLKTTIIDLRESIKLKEYAEKYLILRDSEGFLHASFNPTGAITGRLSCGDPNLQQLTARYRKYNLESTYTGGSERVGGYNLRQALCSRPGYRIVSIDHKQQEARLLAILSGEPTLLKFMAERQDIHMAIAIQVWGDCGKALNKTHREWSKATVFGICYGMSDQSLQEHYQKHGIDAIATEVKDQFFRTFSGLRPWFEKTMRQIEADGGIRYWSGRYWFYFYPSESYKGINAIIQGGAGDFLACVLLRANQVLEATGWGYLISIIHDEALFEIKKEFVDIAAPVLGAVLEGFDIFGVPFLTDIEVGDSYGSLEPFETTMDISKIDWQEYLLEKV